MPRQNTLPLHVESDFQRISELRVAVASEAGPLRSPAVRQLHAWWSDHADGGLPPRSRFDIVDHFRLAPHLFLVEKTEDGDYVYRVRGERVIDLFGGKSRGDVASAHSAAQFKHEVRAYYDRVLSAGTCFVCTGTLSFSLLGARSFESIDCPLADAAGTPRYIIGCIQTIVG